MINKKIKRFLVMLRSSWRSTFDTNEYQREDTIKITKNLVKMFMEIPVEHRLKMISEISSNVLERTEGEIVELKKQMEHIEKHLLEYKMK